MKIAVINYEAGNAHSVVSSLKKIGHQSKLVKNPAKLISHDLIILPGVGSAKATIASLAKMGMVSALNEAVIKRGTPFLGICIGYQIIFQHSEEDNQKCLGWVEGKVKKFDESKVLVPQIGWNKSVLMGNHPQSKSFKFSQNPYYYFVNSYFANPEGTDKDISLYQTDYDDLFTSMIVKKNIVGTQFHVEKSGVLGLKLMDKIIQYFESKPYVN